MCHLLFNGHGCVIEAMIIVCCDGSMDDIVVFVCRMGMYCCDDSIFEMKICALYYGSINGLCIVVMHYVKMSITRLCCVFTRIIRFIQPFSISYWVNFDC